MSARKSLIEGLCCLCGQPIQKGDEVNRDHVPPRRLFGKSLRRRYNPQLDKVWVHERCNQEYKHDEDYFFNTLVPLAQGSVAGDAALADLLESLKYPEQRHLAYKVLAEFGTVQLADGRITKSYEARRVKRVIWKIVRGLHFRETRRVLPAHQPRFILVVGPEEAKDKLPEWFSVVRDTEPITKYGAVFDYKTIGWVDPSPMRGHIWALLLWDRIIALAVFHDPTCGCPDCGARTPTDEAIAVAVPASSEVSPEVEGSTAPPRPE